MAALIGGEMQALALGVVQHRLTLPGNPMMLAQPFQPTFRRSRLSKSPISMPDIPDKSPVPTVAVARATDSLAWALAECLIRKGIIKADDLVAQLDPVFQETRVPGPIRNQSDEDRFATSLALGRIITALGKLSSE